MPTPKNGGTDWLRQRAGQASEGRALPVSDTEAGSVNVESWLKSHGVKYSPPVDIPMTLIDVKRSRLNQARRDPIVADSVDRFAAAMKNGAPFPPIVAYISGGRLTIIDGNNRHAAALKLARESMWGIVIAEDTPSELIQLLTVEANARHGVTPDVQWRLMQAFQLVNLGFTDLKAAQAAAVTPQQISNARRVREAEERAKNLAIRGFEALPGSTKQLLNTLKDKTVFYHAAKAIIDTRMTGDEARQLLRDLKVHDSEKDRVDFIADAVKERSALAAAQKAVERKNSVVSTAMSAKTTLLMAVGRLGSVDEATLVRQCLTEHDRDAINAALRRLEEKLLALQVAMDTLAAMGGENG